MLTTNDSTNSRSPSAHADAKITIGIDIGGTNTDAVLVDGKKNILAACKIPNAGALEEGVRKSIAELLGQAGIPCGSVERLHIGTTHATNAILEAKSLFKVGVLRLAAQRSTLLDPCFNWPQHIRHAAFAGMVTVSGGLRCDQKSMGPLSQDEIRHALEKLLAGGMESLAIIGVFSPLSDVQERQAAAYAYELLGKDFPIALSSEIGGMGFVERENATLLNAALKRPVAAAFQNMAHIRHAFDIKAPFFMTQNDGSIIDFAQALEKPLLTIASGPTNSFIGAAKLAALEEAIIVDVGGTSADIGVVLNGYPRRSLGQTMIGGIPLNFRMPDVLSLPIGGGSLVRRSQTGFDIGPDSLGCRLFREGCAFGGTTLTLTDAAYKAALVDGPAPGREAAVPLTEEEARAIVAQAIARIREGVRLMRGDKAHLPVLAVGGGAFLLKGIADAIPANAGVANAYGASLAEIAHTEDQVVSLYDREKALAEVCDKALRGAVNKGAAQGTVRIVDMQIIPYHYISDNLGRVMATASGRA